MAKFSIRVRSGTARFDVAVVAESEERAIGLLGERYRTSDVRVRSLTGIAGFSVDGPAARTDGSWQLDALAA